MDSLQILILVVLGLLAIATMYGCHRLCLWLEQRGWLYYVNKKPGGSSASCFLELQNLLQPQTQHVVQINEHVRKRSEDEVPGENDPPAPTQTE